MGIKELESPIKSAAKAVKKATPKVVKKAVKVVKKPVKKVVKKVANAVAKPVKAVGREIEETVNHAGDTIVSVLPRELTSIHALDQFLDKGIPQELASATRLAESIGLQAPKTAGGYGPDDGYNIPTFEMPDFSQVFGEIAAAQEQAATALQNFDVPDLPVAPPAPPPIGEAATNIGQLQYSALRRDKYRGANSTIITGSGGLGAGTPGRKTLLGG